jgi:hypothetical protein
VTVVDDRLGISAGAPEIGPDMRQLWDRFPPRNPAKTWPATERPSESVLAQMIAASSDLDETGAQQRRRLGMVRLLGWLSEQSGDTWQQRWESSGADVSGNADWWKPMLAWARPQRPPLRGDLVEQPAGLRTHAGLCRCDPPDRGVGPQSAGAAESGPIDGDAARPWRLQ